MGVLHWTADQFWRATFYEVSCAYIGHCKANGTGKWEKKEDGWSDAEIEDHVKLIDQLKLEFPDEPLSKQKRRERKANADAR